MNIKVDRLKLIEALRSALHTREVLLEVNEKITKNNEAAFKKYTDKLVELAHAGKLKINYINSYSLVRGHHLEVQYALPKNFESYKEPGECIYVSKHELVELKNAIALLEMSDAEQVNASTYKSVVGYI